MSDKSLSERIGLGNAAELLLRDDTLNNVFEQETENLVKLFFRSGQTENELKQLHNQMHALQNVRKRIKIMYEDGLRAREEQDR